LVSLHCHAFFAKHLPAVTEKAATVLRSVCLFVCLSVFVLLSQQNLVSIYHWRCRHETWQVCSWQSWQTGVWLWYRCTLRVSTAIHVYLLSWRHITADVISSQVLLVLLSLSDDTVFRRF